jgi:hypothetical protein
MQSDRCHPADRGGNSRPRRRLRMRSPAQFAGLPAFPAADSSARDKPARNNPFRQLRPRAVETAAESHEIRLRGLRGSGSIRGSGSEAPERRSFGRAPGSAFRTVCRGAPSGNHIVVADEPRGRAASRSLRGFPPLLPRVHSPGIKPASSIPLFPIPYSLFPAVQTTGAGVVGSRRRRASANYRVWYFTPRKTMVPISGMLIISWCFSPKPHERSSLVGFWKSTSVSA